MAGVAAVLLVAGGLDALQQASILAALPFVFILLAMCVALLRGLRSEFADTTAARETESRETSPARKPASAAAGS
jgi:choline-glycine betaine transporter